MDLKQQKIKPKFGIQSHINMKNDCEKTKPPKFTRERYFFSVSVTQFSIHFFLAIAVFSTPTHNLKVFTTNKS